MFFSIISSCTLGFQNYININSIAPALLLYYIISARNDNLNAYSSNFISSYTSDDQNIKILLITLVVLEMII